MSSEQDMLAVLARHSTEALVDAVIRLTHQIASATASGKDSTAAGLRLQRDLCKKELIRRGDA